MDFQRKLILLALTLVPIACDREDDPAVETANRGSIGQGDGVKVGTCRAALTEDGDLGEMGLTSDVDDWNPYLDVPDQESTSGSTDLNLLAEAVTYDGQISKLLGQFCVNCHKPGGDRPDLSTYALAKQNGPSSLSSINRNRMPTQTPLVQADKDLFKAWSDAGFPQNVPPPAPLPPAPAPAPSPSEGTVKPPPAAPVMSPPVPTSPVPTAETVPKSSVQKSLSTNCKK
jgi:hypothetical protein